VAASAIAVGLTFAVHNQIEVAQYVSAHARHVPARTVAIR
jgi:hypothetical protein